jgi:hypothetical protein
VLKYSPPARELRKRPAKARTDWDERDEYADVVPIPFYPDDLPRLVITPLSQWELRYVVAEQRRILFPKVATNIFSL